MAIRTKICKIKGTFSRFPNRFNSGDIVWHDISDTYSHTDYRKFVVIKAYTIKSADECNPWFYVIEDLDKHYTISHVYEEYLFKEKPKK